MSTSRKAVLGHSRTSEVVAPVWCAALGWALFCTLLLFGCELGARLDDLAFDGIQFSESPTYEGLFVPGSGNPRQAKPGARWKKVVINNLGMRGPDVPEARQAGCRRWLFLGASETFGEPSVADAEYPALAGALASRHGCVEILNSAFPGIAPQRLAVYFTERLSRYRPDLVFIYPSTHFYLLEELPRKRAESNSVQVPTAAGSTKKDEPHALSSSTAKRLLDKSRFFERLRDSAEIPPSIQRYRVKQWIEDATEGKPDGWRFAELPEERLDLLELDLRELVRLVRASGAEPVLMTHAVRVANPPRDQDSDDLLSMRVYVPRASEEILASFEYAAAERTRRVSADLGVRLVDVAKNLSGRRELFIDLVHFSSKGHEQVSGLIAEAINQRPQ